MRILFFILLVFTCWSSVSAQTSKNTFYLSSEVNLGNYVGLEYQLNYVIKEKISLAIGYSGNIRFASNRPADFQSGLVNVFLLGLAQPFDQFETITFSAGKIVKLNNNGTTRMNIALGVGYNIFTQAENYQPSGSGGFGPNYTYDFVTYNAISFTLRPRFEFPVSQYFGFTISPQLQVSKYSTFVGVGIGFMLGILK